MRVGAKVIELVALLFFWSSVAWAGAPTDQIKETTDKILAILTRPDLKGPDRLEERNRLIRQAVDERFDWKEMSRRTLARHWAQRTPEEKKEFVDLFGRLLERTYMDRVGNYSGEKVLYDAESVDGNYARVKVRIVMTDGKEVPVLYRLRKRGERWLVYDISVEGVSLVQNYRNQFASILNRSSFQTLVDKLRAKVEGP